VLSKVTSVGSKDELQDAFDIFDRDGDGVLTVQDLVNASKFLKMPMEEEDLRFMFNQADPTQSGKITFDDFAFFFG